MKYYLILFLLLIPSIFAQTTINDEVQRLKMKMPGQVVHICFDENQVQCAPSIDCYISIFYPNNNTQLIANQLTTRHTDYYTINLTAEQTSTSGTYKAVISCRDNGVYSGTQTMYYEVTPTGKTFSTAQSITYVLVFVLVFIIFFTSAYYTFVTEAGNLINSNGEVVSINWKKYFKFITFAIMYMSLVGLLFFAWNISYAFLEFDAMTNLLRIFFVWSVRLAIPIAVIYGFFLILKYISDKGLQKLIDGGIIPTVR